MRRLGVNSELGGAMERKSNRALAGVFAIIAPLAVDGYYSEQREHYDRLARLYELYPLPATCDFDGDEEPGALRAIASERRSGPPDTAVVVDGGRELLRIPYHHTDGTCRTHVALCADGRHARLLVFDGGRSATPYARAAYRLVDREFKRTAPTPDDEEVLSALAAGDDWGTFNQWCVYRFLRLPALLMCLGAGIVLVIASGKAV
jgi:hypothetical protein